MAPSRMAAAGGRDAAAVPHAAGRSNGPAISPFGADMRILVCEFVTGGGMPEGEPIPDGLAREGGLMLRALAGDLLDVPGVEVLVTRDARLPPLVAPVRSITVQGPDEAWELWERLADTVDAVWPIAPESDGALERLSRLVLKTGCRLLNSGPDAVAVTARKSSTATALAAAGLPVVPVRQAGESDDPPGAGPWVVKPDDGAGCGDTRLLRTVPEWTEWRTATAGSGFVVQPYCAGIPASLSMLCRDGAAWPLTLNRQLVELAGSEFRYHGGIVGAFPLSPEMHALADGIAAALPGLAGYVGVDLVMTSDGPMVLEVNPRLTTSYVGIRRSTGMNAAAALLALLQDPPLFPVTVGRSRPVVLDLRDGADSGVQLHAARC